MKRCVWSVALRERRVVRRGIEGEPFRSLLCLAEVMAEMLFPVRARVEARVSRVRAHLMVRFLGQVHFLREMATLLDIHRGIGQVNPVVHQGLLTGILWDSACITPPAHSSVMQGI